MPSAFLTSHSGIFWDPREPCPPEIEERLGRGRQARDDAPNDGFGLHPNAYYITVSNGGLPIPDNDHGPVSRVLAVNTPSGLRGHRTVPQEEAPAPLTRGAPRPTPASVGSTKGRRWVVQEPTRNILTPFSISIEAQIIQDTASVTVTQTFMNDSDLVIPKAAFTFPLPSGCTVTDFTCRFGTSKVLRARVRAKEEAQKVFDEAVRRGDKTGILEQETTEIFTTSLGNIPEQTTVKTEITFVSLLKHRFADEHGITTLTIPTYIAQRYGTPPGDFQGFTSSDFPAEGLSILVEVTQAEKVRKIVSKTHKIAVKRLLGNKTATTWEELSNAGPETASVTLVNGSAFLNRDFVLDIETEPDGMEESPQAWLEEHPTMENQKAVMLTIPSSFMERQAGNADVQESEVLFLADRSGSMSDKMSALKSAMTFFLKGIPRNRKFNIWCFGSTYSSLWPASRKYDQETLHEALEYVSSHFQSDMGGTELLPALEAITKARDRSINADVVVLTDGEVWRLDQTLGFVQRTRTLSEGTVRFFALGVGNAVSHALVEGIARCGGGYSEVIPAAAEGGWEDRVVAMLKAALARHINLIQVDFDTKTKVRDMQRSPADVSLMNPFQGNRMFFIVDPSTPSELVSITISASTPDSEAVGYTVPLTALPKPASLIHKLAARALLDDLERGQSKIHLSSTRPIPGSYDEQILVKQEAESIAGKWSIVSKWSSFVLEEEKSSAQDIEAEMSGRVAIDIGGGLGLLRPDSHKYHGGLLMSRQPDSTAGFDSLAFGHVAWSQWQQIQAQSQQAQALSLKVRRAVPASNSRSGYTSEGDRLPNIAFAKIPAPAFPCSLNDPRMDSQSPQDIASDTPSPPTQSDNQPRAICMQFNGRDMLNQHGIQKFGNLLPPPPLATFPDDDIGVDVYIPHDGLISAEKEPGKKRMRSEQREFVIRLLKYQKFDGCFRFTSLGEAKQTLGAAMLGFIEALVNHVNPASHGRAAFFNNTQPDILDLVFTVAVTVLLEKLCHVSKDLWTLMVNKALDYCRISRNRELGDNLFARGNALIAVRSDHLVVS